MMFNRELSIPSTAANTWSNLIVCSFIQCRRAADSDLVEVVTDCCPKAKILHRGVSRVKVFLVIRATGRLVALFSNISFPLVEHLGSGRSHLALGDIFYKLA